MNSHIKSLANVWANRRQVEDRLGVTYVFTEEALQVFSDHLIKKCISACATDRLGKTVGVEELIKEYFGVDDEK